MNNCVLVEHRATYTLNEKTYLVGTLLPDTGASKNFPPLFEKKAPRKGHKEISILQMYIYPSERHIRMQKKTYLCNIYIYRSKCVPGSDLLCLVDHALRREGCTVHDQLALGYNSKNSITNTVNTHVE